MQWQPYPGPPPAPPPPPAKRRRWPWIVFGFVAATLWGTCGVVMLGDLVEAGQQRAKRDDAAWARAQAMAPGCTTSLSSADCDPVRAYLTAWPSGEHVTQAEELVRRGEKHLREVEERSRDAAQPREYAPPAPPVRVDPRIKCCDGTYSGCTIDRPNLKGCCSHHKGICG